MATTFPQATYTPPSSPDRHTPTKTRRGLGVRYGRLVSRWRWLIVAAWVVLLAVSVPLSVHVTDNLTSNGFSLPGSESTKASDIVTQKFGAAPPQAMVVFQSTTASLSDVAYEEEIAQFAARARAFPHVVSVRQSDAGQDNRTVYDTVTFATSGDTAQNLMPDFAKLLPTTGPARAYLTGDPAVNNQISTITTSDLAQAERVTLPIAGIALLLVFGTLVSALIPLGLALVSVPITLAIIFLISQHMGLSIFVVNIATMIGLGLSIDYSLFLVRRFRDELRAGREVSDAVGLTMATSGEAILFSGVTVLIGFAGLALVRLPFMTSMAIGGVVVVGLDLLGALTLVPAILSILGTRVIKTAIPRPWRRRAVETDDQQQARPGFWQRWALGVMAQPWLVVALVLGVLGVVSFPALSLATGIPSSDVLPATNEARQGLTILAQQFPHMQMNPVVVVLQTKDGSPVLTSANVTALGDVTRPIGATPNTSNAAGLTLTPNMTCDQLAVAYGSGAYATNPQFSALDQLARATTRFDTTLVTLQPTAPVDSAASRAVVTHLRALEAGSPLTMQVGGDQAVSIDLSSYLYGNFRWSLLFILCATYIVLLIMFRSVLLPLKAVLMNVLSVAAAYGALVWVFQQGHLSAQLQFTQASYIEMVTPVLLFCIIFGLSMDYEVFLLSRMREEWRRSGDNRFAVARGLEKTAGVITSAALIMIIVLGAFVFTHLTLTKEIGLGMAVAIFVDATIIRILLVPATMRLLGKWNWWLPKIKARKHVATGSSKLASLN